MKSKFIVDLKAGEEVLNEPFLLQEVARRTTKDARPFFLLTLRDKTGQIPAVFWDIPDYVEGWVRTGCVALITAKVVTYKEGLQVSITDMNPAPGPDMSQFLPSSQRPREEMVAELRKMIRSLAQPWQELLTTLLLEETFLPRFADAPAARSMHHAFVSGLLEHTLSMATIADLLSVHYPHVNRDLLLAGVLLHDVGKAIEYTLDGSFGFSEDGRLIGHIIRGVTLVEAAAATLNFPSAELQQLIHLIASHHGTLEWGSPVPPKTLEAILLHQIDLLDSRIQGYFDHINMDTGEGDWTAKSSEMFRTDLRRPPGYKKDVTNHKV